MAGYIGSKASVVTPGAERKKVFSITTTTTSLTGLVYTPGFVHVYHNGVRLVDGTDYTATNGTSITLTTAAQSGDEVVVISFATFQTSDTVSASAGGTFSNAVTIDANGATVLTVDRATSHGTIMDLQKDGSSIGTFGSSSGNLIIDGTDTATKAGLGIGGSVIYPRKGAADSDNGVDLGNTTRRFKDLYLSGGVYLGGTGAANYLDDYEEGTYSAYMYDALSGGNFVSLGTGYYTKVGNLVTFHFRDSNINTSGLTGTNAAYFSVPFASSSDFGGPCGHSLMRDVNWAGTQTDVSSYLGAGESAFRLYVQGDNVAYTSLKVSEFNSGAADIYFTGSYFSA